MVATVVETFHHVMHYLWTTENGHALIAVLGGGALVTLCIWAIGR